MLTYRLPPHTLSLYPVSADLNMPSSSHSPRSLKSLYPNYAHGANLQKIRGINIAKKVEKVEAWIEHATLRSAIVCSATELFDHTIFSTRNVSAIRLTLLRIFVVLGLSSRNPPRTHKP